MICVLDASASVEIILKRNKAADLISFIINAEKVIAPSLFYAETGNVFRKYVQGGFFEQERGLTLYRESIRLVDEFIDIAVLNEEAVSEAMRLNHSVYDVMYMILARRNGAKLLTCDKVLQQLYNSEIEKQHTV